MYRSKKLEMTDSPRPLTAKELEDWDRWSRRAIAWKSEDVQRLVASVQSSRSMLEKLELNLVIAPHGSPLYQEILALRYEVLRKPLGMEYSKEQLAAEVNDIHLAMLVDGVVKATLFLSQESEGMMRMRQVAVSPELQGKGVGRRLVEEMERICVHFATREIVLDARQVAIPFYTRLGYETYGEPFVQATLPHMKMRKVLAK